MCHFNLTLMKVGSCTCNYPYINRKHKGSASQEENIQCLTEGTPWSPRTPKFLALEYGAFSFFPLGPRTEVGTLVTWNLGFM